MNTRILRAVFFILLLLGLADCTKQEPIASFSVDKAFIGEGEQVKFTDQTIIHPTAWEWTFNGGTPPSSNQQHPTVTYQEYGEYEVSLKVSNGDGSHEVTKENYITVDLPRVTAAFKADITVVDAGGTVNFTLESTTKPDSLSWLFEGGTPLTSTQENPSVQYKFPGVYDVYLKVENARHFDILKMEDYITVNQAGTHITFYNTTYTDITIEINGLEKVIPPDGDVTYLDLTGNSVDYFAWTSGQNADGEQVGYLLNWDNTIELTGPHISRTLLIGDTYYCLFIKNSGTESLNPLEVGIMDTNAGFSADRTENIIIPNDSEEYRIGYYKSFTETEFNWIQIRAHAPSLYVYWSQGAEFALPDTSNQSIHLYSEIKKRAATSTWRDPGDQGKYLYPDYAFRLKEQ